MMETKERKGGRKRERQINSLNNNTIQEIMIRLAAILTTMVVKLPMEMKTSRNN